MHNPSNSEGGATSSETNELRLHHGGVNNNWICPTCKVVYNSFNILKRHVTISHQLRCVITCDLCDQVESENLRSVSAHRRYCKGPVPSLNLGFACDICSVVSFKTNVGLSQHKRLKHAAIYNESLEEQRCFKYSEVELKDMSELEFKLVRERGKKAGVVPLLAEKFPHRTLAAIYKIRKGEVYRAFYQQHVDEQVAEEEGVSEAEEEELVYIPIPTTILETSFHGTLDLDQSLLLDVEIDGSWKENVKESIGDFLNIERTRTRLSDTVDAYLQDSIAWEEVVNRVNSQLLTKGKRKDTTNWDYHARKHPPKNNRSTRRRKRFKTTQKAFQKNKGKAIADIIDDSLKFDDEIEETGPSLDDLFEVYKGRLESVTDERSESFPAVAEADSDCTNYGPFSVDEITTTITNIKKESAPGPDLWKLETIIGFSKIELCMIFNKWYVNGAPKAAKICRTILIYKAGERTEVGNWRPITIGPLMLRIYAKLWDVRLRSNTKINERQKAFLPVDGCFENVKILQHVIKTSRKARKELNIVLLDLAKAFDTVNHQSVVKALRRQRVPETVIDVIKDLYADSSTTISTSKGKTQPINILSGVKQGCPLSPLLFNLVMDSLVEKLQQSGLGVGEGEHHLATLAFADDLVLISDKNYHMEKMIKIAEEFFDERGLTANAKKCVSFRQIPTKKNSSKKTVKIVTASHRQWKGTAIPSLNFDEFAKYLGVHFQPSGKIDVPWDKWDTWLERLKKSSLKPQQKIYGLRYTIIPRMLHQLRLADVGKCKLVRLNTKLRVWFKKVLHLPSSCPNEWIHGKFGGSLQDITNLVLTCRKKASSKMCMSNDIVAAKVGEELDSVYWRDLCRINAEHVPLNLCKQRWEKERSTLWRSRLNGEALTTMKNSLIKRDWIWHSTTISSGKRLRCIQMVAGMMPTRINENRGKKIRELNLCRRCKKTAETDLHILAECPITKDMRSARHNGVCDIIAKALQPNTWKEIREKRWKVRVTEQRQAEVKRDIRGIQYLQPDISLESDNKLRWIEVTCPYERSEGLIQKRHQDKLEYYDWVEPKDLCREDLDSIEVITIVVGACGTILKRTLNELKKLKLAKLARKLSMRAMLESASIADVHFTGDK